MNRSLLSKTCVCLPGIAAAIMALLAGLTQAADDEASGAVWSRIIQHMDGTQTRSVREGSKNEIVEETFDANKVLIAKRLFILDKKDRVRKGIIFDGKENPVGSTDYGYTRDGRLYETRLFNRKGQLVQRIFEPGVLPNEPANARHRLACHYDPDHPNAAPRMEKTNERPILPIDKPMENFVPGMPIGAPSSPVAGTQPAKPAKPSGRRPGLLPQKKD